MTKHTKINKELLYDLYINKRMNTVDVGKIVGKSGTAVSRALKKYNIPVRNGGFISIFIDRDKLELYYIKRNLSLKEVGTIFNVDGTTIRKKLILFDLPLHDQTYRQLPWRVPKDSLIIFYVNKRYTVEQLAAKYQVSVAVIYKSLLKHGIEVREDE